MEKRLHLKFKVRKAYMLMALLIVMGYQSAQSQTFDYAYAEDLNFSGQMQGSIIRGYRSNSAVVLFDDQGGRYFGLLVDATTVYNAVPIPSSLSIYDFQILGDDVYYCGRHSQQGAMVGKFDINELVSGLNVNFDYRTFPQCTTYVLYKLAVASVQNDVSILALGTEKSTPCGFYD